MTRHTLRSILVAALALALAGCGSNFFPPLLDTTGIPPSPLGQVLDVEVSLDHVKLPGDATGGLQLDVRLEFERSGVGELTARVFYGDARHDWSRTRTDVEDLSDGTAVVFVSDERWTTERLGPLRIEGVLFELILDGTPQRGGRYVGGRSWDTLTGREGTFEAWRRHRFLVAGTDFFSGSGRVSEVSLIKERTLEVRNGLELTSSDAVLRVVDGAAYAINRFTFDNVQRLDPMSDFATVWQAGVGPGANPHDVAVGPDDAKLYVTRYEPPYDDLAILPTDGGPLLGEIDLTPFAENPDGTPRPDRMRRVGDTLFVGLQEIDRTFTRFAEGKLAVIDTRLDAAVDAIPLGGENPGAIEHVRGADGRDRLYVALGGVFPGLQSQRLSGGVAVVDVSQRVLERMALDDDDAGGNIGALAMADDALGYVAVSDESFATRVLAFDPVTGTVVRTVLETFDFVPEIELDGDRVLAVPDRSFAAPGLCLYRVPGGGSGVSVEQPLGCAALDAPPFSIEALD